MTGKRRVFIFGHAQIGFGERHYSGNEQRIGGHVTRLAAVDEADTADVIDLRAWRVDVDLPQLDVHVAGALQQTLQIGGAQAGQTFLNEGIERNLRFFRGLILLAALGYQTSLLAHDAGERTVQIVVVKLAKLGTVRGGPIELIRKGSGLVEFLQPGGFGALIAFGYLLELIRQRSDFAAPVLEIGSQDGALAIEQIDLFGDLPVRGKNSAAGAIHDGFELLVIGSAVKGLFGGAALGDLLLEIAGVESAETVLIIAPRAQAKKFAVQRPEHRQQQQKSRDQNQAAQRPADYGIVLLRGKIRQRIPPESLKRDSSTPWPRGQKAAEEMARPLRSE